MLRRVVAERSYTSHAFREHIWNLGQPAGDRAATARAPAWIHHNRHCVQRRWPRPKTWRTVATRYETTANSFMGILCLAAALDWLKN